ncbi:MAG: MBL fold metallo-hydrolase, partial [Acidimicrobiales bacterium]|nr:MBL fold metallo-hydrolase [Acidimicrobiales bacterium]
MTARPGAVTLEWFGTSTFRIRSEGLDLFFDAYLDRLPGLPPVGLSLAEVDHADYVFVSHAHFEHICGAEIVARRSCCTVAATPESARVLR